MKNASRAKLEGSVTVPIQPQTPANCASLEGTPANRARPVAPIAFQVGVFFSWNVGIYSGDLFQCTCGSPFVFNSCGPSIFFFFFFFSFDSSSLHLQASLDVAPPVKIALRDGIEARKLPNSTAALSASVERRQKRKVLPFAKVVQPGNMAVPKGGVPIAPRDNFRTSFNRCSANDAVPTPFQPRRGPHPKATA